ncbi:nuclear transport factor 2 family protein [Streptomyces sp. NPDC014006]|uniref:nuclear transport factor 2 family protein n=1 Tax=Streptomyces sp. NPDC014006 TaxID=3364870 RepID=UPI0036F9F55A
MTLTNVAQVQELYRSFEEGDWARVLGCFSEDVEWTQPGTARLSGVHRGRDAVAEFFVDIARYGLSVRPIELFGQGDRVVAVVAVELAGQRANEVDRFTLQDGRIVAVEHIGDTEMLSSVVTGGAAS